MRTKTRRQSAVAPASEFQQALAKAIDTKIAALKRESIVGMGLDNLRMAVTPPPCHLKGAPAGTNAQYFYAQMFRETVEADSRRLEFVIPR